MLRTCVVTAFAVVGLLAGTSSAVSAAPILYPDLVGISVMYVDIQESSVTDPGVALFGAPDVDGDTLNFDNMAFGASSVGGVPDLTDGTLNFTVMAKPNQVIDSIILNEVGDFSLGGLGGAATSVSVSAPVIINIKEVDGVSINPINLNTMLTFAPSDGDWNLLDDGAVNGIWTGSLAVDLEQMLIDAGVSYVDGVTKVSVTLDNTLMAFSEATSASLIAKKDFQGLSVTAIPEPGTLALLAAAAGLYGLRRR